MAIGLVWALVAIPVVSDLAKVSSLEVLRLLAKGAKRLADGTLKLARARTEQNALLPQHGDWQKLLPTLRDVSAQALRTSHVHRPRAALAPRHAQPNFCMLAVTAIQGVYYDAAQQRLAAVLVDSDGGRFIAQRDHEAHAPQALDAFAAALQDQFGPTRRIAWYFDYAISPTRPAHTVASAS